MTDLDVRPAVRDVRPAPRSLRLSPTAAFYLQVSIVVFFLAGSSAPTPLYALYQAEWGFSPITTTIVFGVYALAVLSALLTVGSLSDHVGRRPVLLAAIAAQAVTMLVFTTATGVPELLIARVVQGLSTGAAVGALGAGLLDLHKTRGTIANAVAPLIGVATGSIGSGLLVQYLPVPAHLVYLVLLVIFVAQGFAVLVMEETATRRPGALASLRPQFGVPGAVRRPVFVAIPILVAAWALPGFYGSVGPALVRVLVGSNSFVFGGLALFVLATSGGLAVLALHASRPRTEMILGTVGLFAGVGVTLVALQYNSPAVFFVGAILAGAGFGAGFQGAIRTVVPLAAPHERAGVLSILYVVSYLALGLPAVIAGFLVVHDGGLLTTAREYGFAVMGLAALAGLSLVLAGRWPRALHETATVISLRCTETDVLADAS